MSETEDCREICWGRVARRVRGLQGEEGGLERRPWEEMGQFFALESLVLPKAPSHTPTCSKGGFLGTAPGVKKTGWP